MNPSGAAAPLDENGYASVADCCCQAEMEEFISRAAFDLNIELCQQGGMEGIAPFHSCEHGPQTFAKLTEDLMAASTGRLGTHSRSTVSAPISIAIFKPSPVQCSP